METFVNCLNLKTAKNAFARCLWIILTECEEKIQELLTKFLFI